MWTKCLIAGIRIRWANVWNPEFKSGNLILLIQHKIFFQDSKINVFCLSPILVQLFEKNTTFVVINFKLGFLTSIFLLVFMLLVVFWRCVWKWAKKKNNQTTLCMKVALHFIQWHAKKAMLHFVICVWLLFLVHPVLSKHLCGHNKYVCIYGWERRWNGRRWSRIGHHSMLVFHFQTKEMLFNSYSDKKFTLLYLGFKNLL